jgi:hypothetical protein
MTLPDFVAALEQELQLTGRPFDRGALLAFAESVYLLAEDEPGDVLRWAAEFLHSQTEAATPV